MEDLKQKLNLLAAQAEKSLDLEGLLALARSAPELDFEPVVMERQEPVRIAVAMDKAFCFYYGDNLKALEELGAELVYFSPLADEKLPDDCQGLYLGGGYPELYTPQLGQNQTMLESIRTALAAGLPCIAECGGFMYLTQAIAGTPMAGTLEGECYDNGKLTRFGYVTLTARKDNLLCRAGGIHPGPRVPPLGLHHPRGGLYRGKGQRKVLGLRRGNPHVICRVPPFSFLCQSGVCPEFLYGLPKGETSSCWRP